MPVPKRSVAPQPAPYTETIIERLAELIPHYVPKEYVIHDPFAGDGTRLGLLCKYLGYEFTGTDLVIWKGRHKRVLYGDSTDLGTYPDSAFAIVTSPTYNNGINDHFLPQDKSRRLTYRVAAGQELHINNTGRYSGRGSKRGEQEYWRLTREVVKNWTTDIVMVNVKDSIRAGAIYPLVKLWKELLIEHGWFITEYPVPCPGWRFGTNHDARVDDEMILVGQKH